MINYKIELGESGNEFIPFAKRKTEYEIKIADQYERMAFSRNYQISEEVSIFVRGIKIAGNWAVNLKVSGGNALEFFYSAFIQSTCKCRDLFLVYKEDPYSGPPGGSTSIFTGRTIVTMQDGDEIASFEMLSASVSYLPRRNIVGSTDWSGHDHVKLLNYEPFLPIPDGASAQGQYSLAEQFNFLVPEDACYPKNEFIFTDFQGMTYPTVTEFYLSTESSDTTTDKKFFLSAFDGSSYVYGDYGNTKIQHFEDGSRVVTFTNALLPYLQSSPIANSDYLVANGSITFKADGTTVKEYSQTAFEPYVAAYSAWSQRFNEYSELNPIKRSVANNFIAGRDVATVRERARLKKCSKEFIATLESGLVPNDLYVAMQRREIHTSKSKMLSVMSVETETSESGTDTDKTIIKLVALSYEAEITLKVNESIPAPNNVQVTVLSNVSNADGTRMMHLRFAQVVTGKRRFQRLLSDGSAGRKSFTVEDYENWLNVDEGGVTFVENAGYPDFHPINVARQGDYRFKYRDIFLCNIKNGQVVSGAQNVQLASYYSNNDPPYPVSFQDFSYSYPEIYVDFRVRGKREVAAPGEESSAFLDASFPDGELLDVYPLTVVHEQFGDLGIFAATKDRWDQTKVKLRCDSRFTYKYNYVAGEWTLDSKAKFTNSPLMPYYDNTGNEQAALFENFVFRSRKAFPDLVQQYKNQKKDIEDAIIYSEKFQLYKKLRKLEVKPA